MTVDNSGSRNKNLVEYVAILIPVKNLDNWLNEVPTADEGPAAGAKVPA